MSVNRIDLVYLSRDAVERCYVCGEPLAPWPSRIFSPPAFAPRFIAVHDACEPDYVAFSEHQAALRSLQ
ncbi:MAG: hypothetical protein ACHQ0J_05045 [Candidatus Dormibacterales bacterium]